jgi:hypothetical protein
MKTPVPFVLFVGFLGASAAPALAESYLIRPDGSGDLPTIAAAALVAAFGDTIELADGVFTGDGNRDVEILGLVVRSTSGDPGACVIDCEGSAADPHAGLYVRFGLQVDGITIRNAYTTSAMPRVSGGGLLVDQAVLVTNCVFTNNFAEGSGGGIKIRYMDDAFESARVRNCVIAGNRAGSGGGIAVEEANPEIEGCVITGNRALTGSGGGILFEDSDAEILSSTIAGNFAEANGGGFSSDGLQLYENAIIWDNCALGAGDEGMIAAGGAGFTCCVVDSAGIDHAAGLVDYTDCVFDDPLFCGRASCDDAPTIGGDYTLSLGSPALPEGNVCLVLIGALGQACDLTPAQETSWSRIKIRFGRGR